MALRASNVCAGVPGQHYGHAITIVCKCNEDSSIYLQHTLVNERHLVEVLQINLTEAVQDIPLRASHNEESSLDLDRNRHRRLQSHKGFSLEEFLTEFKEVSVHCMLMQGCFH